MRSARSTTAAVPQTRGGDTRNIADLLPNDLNPRALPADDEPKILELAESIQSLGLLQPLLITPANVIVAGHRRWIACRLAGWKLAQVVVRDLSEAEQIQAMLTENMQREALNPLEIARACKALIDRGGTSESIAERVGVAATTVRRHLLILDLPIELQTKCAAYEMPLGYLTELARLKNKSEQIEVATNALTHGWRVSELANVVSTLLKPVEEPSIAIVPRSGGPRPQAVRSVGTTARPSIAQSGGGASPNARLIEVLCEATTLIQRRPHAVNDPVVKDWIERFASVWRGAAQSA